MKNKTINNAQDHVQLTGMSYFDEGNTIMFAPDEPVSNTVEGFRKKGYMQVLSDGTYEFVPSTSSRKRCKLIKKLPHGRLAQSEDTAVVLTLRIYPNEGVDIAATMVQEVFEAAAELMYGENI